MSGRIGIVTVTHNSASVLPEFLESVWKQTHEDFILYIVDSGSTDGTEGRLREIEDPRVRCLIQDKNIGFAAGSNVGIKAALEEGCDKVMLLNNDIVFGPELFQKLSEGLEARGCDMVAPKMLYFDPPNKIWAAGDNLNRWMAYRQDHEAANQLDDGRFDRPRRITFAPFCCILMRRSVFERIGILDEAYFVYVEDLDYCYRALKAGLSIWYLPDCKLWHKVSSLTGHLSDFMVEACTQNRMYFLRKHYSRAGARFWYTTYSVYYALQFVLGKTSRERWRLRRKAARRGWRLAEQFPAGLAMKP